MAQRKRILIISYYFAPQNLIGAVRPTKLAKYLARMGHEVTVICGLGRDGKVDPTLQRDLQELQDVRLIHECNPLRAFQEKKRASQSKASAAPSKAAASSAPKHGLKKLVSRLKDAAYISQFWLADESFRRKAVRELKRLEGKYDAVFSTHAPMSVHLVAAQAKRMGVAKRWIADFRDEVVMWFQWMNYQKKNYFRMLRREADVICSVSQGFLEMMGLDDIGRVLSNGYDREDIPKTEKIARNEKTLRVVYCGQITMFRKGVPDRDLTPMLRALRRLVDDQLITKDEIRLVYAGGEGDLMRRYAADCGLEGSVEDHGYVSRERSIELQHSADILLMASAHMQSQRGILTGKLFEYMMMDKPIICCMNGDLTGSGVRQVLSETGMGFCCEEAAGKADEEALYIYVRKLVERWREGSSLLVDQNQEAAESYAYPKLAEKLEAWIDN